MELEATISLLPSERFAVNRCSVGPSPVHVKNDEFWCKTKKYDVT